LFDVYAEVIARQSSNVYLGQSLVALGEAVSVCDRIICGAARRQSCQSNNSV